MTMEIAIALVLVSVGGLGAHALMSAQAARDSARRVRRRLHRPTHPPRGL